MSDKEVRRATREFQNALQADQQRMVKKADEEIEYLMTSGQTREVWGRILWWYYNAKGHNPPPVEEEHEPDI